MESLQQMAPPPEEKPAYDFQARKAAAKPKLDKAEITPMIKVQTEENRLVFEEWSWIWRRLPDRPGLA